MFSRISYSAVLVQSSFGEMVEAVAVVASLIAVIQITDRIIGVCKLYIGAVRDAPSDLRNILLETSMLKVVFENMKFLADCNNGASTTFSVLSSEDGPIKGCHHSIAELEKLFPSDCIQVAGQGRSKKRKLKATLATLAWPFKEKKAKKLMEDIMCSKATITLAITSESMRVPRLSSSKYF